MIMEVDKSKICSVVLQAPDTGELMVQKKPEVILLKNFLLLEKDCLLFYSGLQLIG